MSKVETYQQEIMDAIEWLEYQRDMFEISISKHPDEIAEVLDYWRSVVRKTETAITALRAQLAPVSGCWYCTGIESHSIATVKTVTDEYGRELGAYDTPYNYCPNCGRRLTLTDSESTQSGAIRSARGDAE